ncbi:retrovirus-related pol polyprotein from transposon TNT 1-94, partial [Tanacetum coccineum]
DFQDSPDDEEDTRSSQEYLNDLEEEYQARALLAKSKRFFKKSTQRFSSTKATDKTECHKCGKKGHFHKPELRPTKDFESKYNKVKAKLALLSSSASAFKAPMVKNKGLVAEAYEWDKEEVSSDDNEIVEVKVLMALAEENNVVSKESARIGEWVKIYMRKVHTLLEMENNNDRKVCLNYLCIDLNFVEEQRSNLLSKHRNLVHELNTCKEQLLVLKQAKLDFLTMQHVNTKILKENINIRSELKELKEITKTWLNSSNKVNQCDDTKVTIPGVKRPWLSEAEGFILPNHDTGRILPAESQRNTTDPSIAFIYSSATDYDSADKSSVCSTPLPQLKKLEGAEPISGPKTTKSILKSKSTLKDEALKAVIINEPSSAHAKGNKSSSALKVHSTPASKLKSVKIKDDHSLAIIIKELNILFCKRRERTDHRTCDHAEYMSTMNMSQHLKSLGRASSRPNIPRPSKRFFPPCIHCDNIDHLSNECLYYPICKLCGSYDHDINGHNRIISLKIEINPRNPQHAFKRCEACVFKSYHNYHLDNEWFKRGETLQAKKAEALKSTRCDIRKPIWYLDSGCSRHMTCVKSYLHEYVEQPGPKVMFGDDSTCTIEGYGSIKCNGIVFTKLDEKIGTIFNSNKEVVMIAPRHKRLAHLNFKTINKLAKQNLVIGLPSLVYSKDKPCSSCEKGKHHRSSFKTKQTSSIKKCLHLLHMDLFGPVTPRSINHEKYTLVIIDEYSRTDNGTEFKNSILVNFYDEKGISQNFSSPYTPEQNGVAERKNRTLIEAARTMLSGSVFSKQYWTEAVATACYTQNRSTIVKRHLKTPYEIFRKRIPNINFLHVFGCPVYIHNHKDHLGKFDEKADDGYLLGYSLVSKAFRVFNTRRQQTKETYHITFDESPDAIKFSKPSVDNINIAETERYPPDEYLHPYEPSQRDETGIVIKNKARLVAQGYNQQEGINYDKTFAPVAKLEAIRIFLAFPTCMNFIVYQMDVKNAFLNGKLIEEIYVKQPSGFESNEFPNHVCKLDKALYGLKQAPRACYGTLSTFSLNTSLYEMSMMGVLTYFFGFQIRQSERGISINQEKYVKDLLKKYDINGSSVKTPMVPLNNLGPDLSGKSINETQYRGMIGSLMYLTASRPDIQLSTCLCARYQANPKESHLIVVKRIFRYLKGTHSLGLWYLKCSGLDLKGYSDSDYAGCNMDKKAPQVLVSC